MRIGHNIPALASYNASSLTNALLGRSIARLSTVLRISSAADDAAGLAISEKMRAQYRGVDQAERNAQDGISMIQTAEGALGEVHSILQRMRELSVQASNDTLTQDDRAYIQLEIDELKSEIDRISTTTQFNKKKLLDGSSDAVWSTDALDASVVVRGAARAGNFRVVVTATEGGRGQVQKSNIFTESRTFWIDTDGDDLGDEKVTETKTASLGSVLSDITAFYDENGRFLLEDPQQITLSFAGSGERTVTIYANDTIEQLGLKLNEALFEASGVRREGSIVQWVGGGEPISGVIRHDVSPLDEYADMLMTGLLDNAAKIVEDKLGLRGNNDSVLYVVLDDTGTLPAETWYTEKNGVVSDTLTMYVGEEFFKAMDDAKWEDAKLAALRETMRAMEYANKDLLGAMFNVADPSNNKPPLDASWLHEGLVQYIGGGNAVALQAFGGMPPAQIRAKMASAVGTGTNTGFNLSDPGYAAACYLAVRFYDEQSIANGGTGIKGLVAELAGGVTIDAAIAATSGFGSMAGFRAAVTGAGRPAFDAFINNVLNENTAIDGGFIGGQFASGGPAQTRADLAKSLLGNNYKANPLAGHGFDDFDIYPYTRPTEETFSEGGGLLSTSAPRPGTMQSVEGTLLLHSNIAGAAGRITLSGGEDILKALGFTEIQSAEEPVRRVDIFDAHSGETVLSGAQFSGRTIFGALGDGIDIEVPLNFALEVDPDGTTSGGYRTYKFNKSSGDFIVHIADRATVLQIGANEGETMTLSFGATSTASLGVARLKVTDRESAARAITLVDGAISEVSRRRSRLGAYQNRLEHTTANLSTASTSLKSSESRIRDLDMAREMMTFTRLNILSQSGSSMLAQANNLPQNVLALLRA